MRPINLIPPEERRGTRAPMRSGPLAYIVLGALLAALAGVTFLIVTNNQISNRKAEVATLQAEATATEARATELSAYTQFHQTSEQRIATVSNLANSRFDWERVMRELALTLPSNVWLTNLTGTAAAGVSVNGAASIALRESVPGPALEMEGCATGQEAVAGFVSSLKEIEGVTRVGVQSSELPGGGEGSGASDGGGSVSAGGSCQTRNFIAQFQIVVAFDAAPILAEASGTEAAVAPAPEASSTETTASSEGEAAPEGEGG